MASWRTGNTREPRPHRGWLVGHFIDDADDLRHSKDVEVKWGIHQAGEERTDWSAGRHERTLLILVSGRWRLDLAPVPRRHEPTTLVLDKPGDYVMWDKGVARASRGHTPSGRMAG